jgi:hypothetical protein
MLGCGLYSLCSSWLRRPLADIYRAAGSEQAEDHNAQASRVAVTGRSQPGAAQD